ncbi:MAG: choice-of-anchor Q domain-containing protein, partial [Planctomycetota bacterium]
GVGGDGGLFSDDGRDGIGGGIANRPSGIRTVVNCLFRGNVALFGGGMFNWDDTYATVTNCTFTQNAALDGGGLYNQAGSFATVANCIFWHDTGGEIHGSAWVTYSDVEGGWWGPGWNNIHVDPIFADFYGRLSPGSPCIDAGDNTEVPIDITTDLDGNPRFVDDPDTVDTGHGGMPAVDMGAYEFQTGCPWDCGMPADGQVSVVDFLALLAQWGGPGTCDCEDPPDGAVDVGDFLALLAAWGDCP